MRPEHDPDSDQYDPDADARGLAEDGLIRLDRDTVESAWTAEIAVHGCPAPAPTPLEASRSKRERVSPVVMFASGAALLLASNYT